MTFDATDVRGKLSIVATKRCTRLSGNSRRSMPAAPEIAINPASSDASPAGGSVVAAGALPAAPAASIG
jgi:hypothetical protein